MRQSTVLPLLLILLRFLRAHCHLHSPADRFRSLRFPGVPDVVLPAQEILILALLPQLELVDDLDGPLGRALDLVRDLRKLVPPALGAEFELLPLGVALACG